MQPTRGLFAAIGFLAFAAACGSRTGIGDQGGVSAGGAPATTSSSTGAEGGSNRGGCGKCEAATTCAEQGATCGTIGDGCGCLLDCGTCTTPGESCGASGTPNVCGLPCTPSTCDALKVACGTTGDGCSGTLSCGVCAGGQECGAGAPNTCGFGSCGTCASQGFNCGVQDDGCGNPIDCGTCPSNQLCGVGSPGKNGVCGAPSCTPLSCAEQGFNCGQATDTCGNIISCGSCAGNQICGGKNPNVCGPASGTCTNLCLQQVACPGGETTTITGTVFAPQGTDPLYGALVYVPNAPVQPFTQGVACGDCSAQVTGAPLVSAITGADGTFTITNVPAGKNIPLVIQNGRWRRQFVIPNVAACTTTALPSAGMPQIRMPETHLEGDIPQIAFVTGFADQLECVLRKIGIADSEFTDPGGGGRVQFYAGETNPGAVISANTPPENQLWGTQAAIDQYDMVFFACQGMPTEQMPSALNVVQNFANSGGRLFATHYNYSWLYDNGPFATTATWDVDQMPEFQNDPGVGTINTSFPEGLALAQWLQNIYPTTTLGQIPIATLRHDFDAVVPPSLLWITDTDPGYPAPVPMHYTFDTPVGAPSAAQCGRSVFSDFHVDDAMSSGLIFPSECSNGPMTPQEKLLEFVIFDLGSCVHLDTCQNARTCTDQQIACGAAGDGCGNILQCGMCPAGELCVSGQCIGCVPKTCGEQGFSCGAQDDGCGNALSCGECQSNDVCVFGTCKTGLCKPGTCSSLGFTCGSQGDGCGNLISCGDCPANETCIEGTCQATMCTPKSCSELGFNCGLASDGCNGIVNCGACPEGQICGGGSAGNVCAP